MTYLAMAPKSNALYTACEDCKKDVRNLRAEPVPLHLCNAPTNLMKELHYGRGYQYAHDTQEKLTNMKCLPESLQGREYYHPTAQGQEARVQARLQQVKRWKSEHAEEREQ